MPKIRSMWHVSSYSPLPPLPPPRPSRLYYKTVKAHILTGPKSSSARSHPPHTFNMGSLNVYVAITARDNYTLISQQDSPGQFQLQSCWHLSTVCRPQLLKP